MTVRYHVAVRRPTDDRLLVLRDGALPGFALEVAPSWPEVTPVVDAMRALGLEVVALRAAWVDDPRLTVAGGSDRLYEVAYVGGSPPEGADWIPLEALERRPTPLGQAIDAGVLEPAAGAHQPWYRPDWASDMTAWIDEALAAVGRRRTAPIRQVRSWGRSALLSVETDGGRLWAKQVPAVFAHEVAVSALLADLDPGIVPPLVAGDVAAGRLLMEHVDGPLLTDVSDPGPWMATISRLAELQHVLAADTLALEVAGVPHASSAELAARLPTLAHESPGWAGLRASLDARLTDLERLEGSSVGRSLDHGDLTARQVIVGEMGPVFLDWSDATIAHPYLAAASFLGDAMMSGGGVPVGGVGPLGDAYLVGWRTASDAGRAELDAAGRVQPLHMARQCQDRMLSGLEQPWELAWLIPWLLDHATGAAR